MKKAFCNCDFGFVHVNIAKEFTLRVAEITACQENQRIV